MKRVSLDAPEVRTLPACSFRAVEGEDPGRYLEGLAVPYGVWSDVGWFMERFAAGALSKSIKESAAALPLLLWHDSQSFPIGKVHEWKDTEEGLWCVWELDTEDPRAMEAARKAQEGYLTGLSVGFVPIASDMEIDDEGIVWVTQTEARLLEVSLTPTPAYAGANVQLVRSRLNRGGKRRSAELDKWRAYLDAVAG